MDKVVEKNCDAPYTSSYRACGATSATRFDNDWRISEGVAKMYQVDERIETLRQ
jgi:hypothetical protein